MNLKYLIHRMKKSKTVPVVLGTILCIIIMFIYFSYAMFTSYSERRGSLNIITGNLFSVIESSALDENNQITVVPNETTDFSLVLTNINHKDARVNLFFSSDDNLVGVTVGYLITGESAPQEYGIALGAFGSSTDSIEIDVRIQNEKMTPVTITFGTKAGLVDRNLYFPSEKLVLTEFLKEEIVSGGTMMEQEEGHAFWNWDFISRITYIVFSHTIDMTTTLPTEADIWDVSRDQDESVIAFLTEDNTANTCLGGARTCLVLNIQSDGRIMAPEDSARLFQGFMALQGLIHPENFDTSNVTNMFGMFSMIGGTSVSDNNLTLDLSSFDTSNVTQMDELFYGSYNILELNLSVWDTRNVENMHGMFYYLWFIEELDLRSFNTMNVVDKQLMFAYTDQLESVFVTQSTWRTTGLLDSGMFNGSLISSVTFA